MSENARVSKLIDEILDLSLIDTNVLINGIKNRLGLPDIPYAAASAPPTVETSTTTESKPEKENLTLRLISAGEKRPDVIRAVRKIMQEEGNAMTLKEVSDLVKSAPSDVLVDVLKEKALSYLSMLKEAGAEAETL